MNWISRYILDFFWNSQTYLQFKIEQNTNDISENELDIQPTRIIPLVIQINETNILQRNELYQLINKNKEYFTIKFYIQRYFSIYLLCYLVFDLLDLLSNEFSKLQTKFEFIFEDLERKEEFISELQVFLKSKMMIIQNKKIAPIYSNFLQTPNFQINYCMITDHKFNILFLKETTDQFFIQRIYFSIDI
jgi:hypothetical protein